MNLDRECLEVAAATCRECHDNPTVYELAEVFGALRALARVTARGQMESTATVMLEMARDAISEIIRWLPAGRMDGEAATARLRDLDQQLMAAARMD